MTLSGLWTNLAAVGRVTSQAQGTKLKLPQTLMQLDSWAAPKLANPSVALLTSSKDLRHYLLLKSIQTRYNGLHEKVALNYMRPQEDAVSMEIQKQLDEFHLDELMRWVPSSFDRVHIRIDPINDECPKSIRWAHELANLYTSHSRAILGVPAGCEEANDEDFRRKWNQGYFEIDVPQRYDLENGKPIKHERKPARDVREKNMFWGGWYLNEGGIHVKVPEKWNGSAEEVVAARVKLGVWGLFEDEFGPLKDTWMLNQHDIHELPSDTDANAKTLIHLPTGLTSQVAQETDCESALVLLLKQLYMHDEKIAGGRACSGRGARHSLLKTHLAADKSLASYGSQVVRIYSKDRVDDLVSGYRSPDPAKLFSEGATACDVKVFHEVLLASLEHHALSSIQEVIKSLVAAAKAEEAMKRVK